MVYNGNGMYSETLAICENALETEPNSERMLTQAAVAYARSGRRERAQQIANRLDDLDKTQYVSPYGRAAVQVALGDHDKAFALLEKSLQVHDWWLHRLNVDPQFAPLRDDPALRNPAETVGFTAIACMKHCPECNRNYADPTLSFCLRDAAPRIFGAAVNQSDTAILSDDFSEWGSGGLSALRPFLKEVFENQGIGFVLPLN
jgi:tetratricopeptide (TPR) repeat protein